MTDQPKPLDQETCEAIAERFRAQRSNYTNMGGQCIGSMAKWAEQFVRGMAQEAKQPEPPTTPTAGALRASSAIREAALMGQKEIAHVATIIDRETGVPELVAACQGMIQLFEICKGGVFAREAIYQLQEPPSVIAARAALAKHETGVSEM